MDLEEVMESVLKKSLKRQVKIPNGAGEFIVD